MQNSYQTRRLLALRNMRHDGQNVVIGGEVFFATETDARYLIRNGHARAADEPAKESPKVAVPVPPARRGPGRPGKAEIAARAQTPVADVAPAADAPSSAPADAMTMVNFSGARDPDGASGETPGAGADDIGSDTGA